MKAPKPWDRKLWAAVWAKRDASYLVTGAWPDTPQSSHKGEPIRPLLFTTRKAAREWCQSINAASKKNQSLSVSAGWKFRPVRVRETVTVIS